MSTIKNVAFAGASGALGTKIFEKLVAAGIFNITVLRRKGSSSTFPSNITVVDVDFGSAEELTAALKGSDALVSAIGTEQIAAQTTLIDAAIAAGVKRILPSEFGSDLDNPNTRKLPVFSHKVKIQDHLIETAKKNPEVSYTFVYNSGFLDWGLEHDFILKVSGGKPVIFDGGNTTFSTTTLASVGDAVVGVLKHPEETKNRAVYIEDTKITQNKLLELAKKVKPNRDWTIEETTLDETTGRADERLVKGLFDAETFVPYIFRAIFGPDNGGNFQKTDNELLGVKGVTEDDIVEILKKYVK